jgi:hypothetical protein
MDRAAFDRWQLENRLLEDLLCQVERHEQTTLREMNCPTDAVGIYRILNGETPAPWPKRTAARDRQRARFAMHALLQIAKTRQHLAIGQENPRLAAHAALLAGLHANAAMAVLAEPTVKGRKRAGDKTGQLTAAAAARNDSQIARYRRQWELSEHLQDEFRSAAAYVADKTGIDKPTIYRRFRKLPLSQGL